MCDLSHLERFHPLPVRQVGETKRVDGKPMMMMCNEFREAVSNDELSDTLLHVTGTIWQLKET
jgi:hypothetical protein